jgi:hypothetical protein
MITWKLPEYDAFPFLPVVDSGLELLGATLGVENTSCTTSGIVYVLEHIETQNNEEFESILLSCRCMA